MSEPENDVGGGKRVLGRSIGRYITKEGLDNVKIWAYKSSGATTADKILDIWWEFAATCIPKTFAPNTLTLIGFIATVVALLLVFIYMPTLEESAPRPAYFVIAILIFIHQTLDAVDGKHARNTGSSSPLGQIFDHGCDSFTTVFAVFITAASSKFGLSFATYTLLGLLQMQMFIYTWWDLHFHVYRCSTGGAGVTEGQLVMMFINLIAGVFGPKTLLMTVYDVAPSLRGILSATLVGARIQTVIAAPFYLLLLFMLFMDLVKGCRQAPDFANVQLLGCVFHIIVQYFFFSSGLMRNHPRIGCLVIVMNSSIVVLRMILSAACKLPCSTIHWPVIPFYVMSVFLYIWGDPYSYTYNSKNIVQLFDEYIIYTFTSTVGVILFLLLLWATVYLYLFMTWTIYDICDTLKISCFHISSSSSGDDSTASTKICGSSNFKASSISSNNRSSVSNSSSSIVKEDLVRKRK